MRTSQKTLISIVISCISLTGSFAQKSIPTDIIKKINHISDLITHDQITELASLIKFPIIMQNPIPDILSPHDFILSYNLLMDSTLKQKFIGLKLSDIFQDKYSLDYGLLSGTIYINSAGEIVRFNCRSDKTKVLEKQLREELISTCHPSIKPWKENILVCQTDKYLIRLDFLPDKSYRLICWNRPGNLKTKPDIMLYTGEDNIWLSRGGSEYRFKEGDKTYLVNDRYLCGGSTKCGLFYSVETKGMEDFKVECSRIK